MSATGDSAAPPVESVRSIACLMLNGVGDILCVTPAVEALKHRYPGARLTMMVRPHLRGLVEDNPAVDEVIAFGSATLGERIGFLREIRHRRFDLWVDLHTPTFNTMTSNARHFVRNAVLAVVAGARCRRAYAVRPLSAFLTHPLAVPPLERLRGQNVVDLALALAWPLEPSRYRKCAPATDEDRLWAAQALPGGDTRRVALYFGTRQPAKLWPQAHCARLLALVLERLPDVQVVLVGDATDVARARALAAGAGASAKARILDFTGATTFGRTAALLARCAAAVSTDSGAMHIADAAGIPVVAMFSSHNYPGIWRPVNARSVVIHHEIECGPCFLASCPVGNRCMAAITPEEVFAELVRRLSG